MSDAVFAFRPFPAGAPLPAGFLAADARTESLARESGDIVQAGFPSPAASYQEKPIDFNELLNAASAATFALRARGDSMSAAGIADGDLLVVDRRRTPRSGDIVVMQVNNDFTVKRLLEKDGRPYLHPESRSAGYRDLFPAEGDEWVCFGVVRHVVKSL